MVGHYNIKKYYQHSEDYLESLKRHNDKIFTEYLNTVKKYVVPDSTILEIGCGTGLSSKLMSEEGYDVTGVEISELFLKESADFMSCNLKYCVADTEKLPFGDHVFNAVVAYDVIEHIENIDRVLKELDRVLNPGGILLLMSPNFFTIHKPFVLYHCFTNIELPGWTTGGFLTKLRYDLITYFGIVTKSLFRRPCFYKRKPNLHSDIVGKDIDSVYMTSPIDLYKFFQNKYEVINYQGKEKNVRIFLDSLRGQTKIVFKKTKEVAI